MPDGIIVIDKPQDWTSNDVVVRLKRTFWERRIGHGGTLDPMATGVLPVFVGRATRAASFCTEGEKEYIAGLRLGVETDTQDSTGTVLNTSDRVITRGELEQALPAFRGVILQVPPMYSAIKVDGKRLYDLARKGKEVERAARPVTIYGMTVEEERGENCFTLRVRCSKGTYIRTLCHDIGASLGVGGIMESLRRTAAAGFRIEDAIPLEKLLKLETEDARALLKPIDSAFAQYPAVTVSGEKERRCRNGNDFRSDGEDGLYRVYGEDGTFLMLGERTGGTMKNIKNFF